MNFFFSTFLLVLSLTFPASLLGVPFSINDLQSTIFASNLGFNDVITRGLGKVRHSGIKAAPIIFDNLLLGLLFPDWQEHDVIALEDASLDFDSNLLSGQHSYWNSEIRGIPTLSDKVSLEVLGAAGFAVNIQFDLGSITLSGDYESDLNILSGGLLFSGVGIYSVHLDNVSLSVGGTFTPTEDPSILVDDLHINFGFQNLNILADNSLINCIEPRWDEITYEINLILTTFWPTLNTKIVTPLLEPLLNDLLKTCDLNDIIFNQDLSCIGEVVPDVGQVWTEFIKMVEKLKPNAQPQLLNACMINTGSPSPTGSTGTAPTPEATGTTPSPTGSTGTGPTSETTGSTTTKDEAGTHTVNFLALLLSLFFVKCF